MSFSSPFSQDPFSDTPIPPDSFLHTLPRSPENDILNAFKENELTEGTSFLEKGKKPVKTLIHLPTPYIYNDISINNPNLALLIDNLLRGIPPNDQELQQLNDVEKDLFNCIRERKIYTDEERNETLFLDQKAKKGKRLEESQKLFFKKAYAFLETAFFRKHLKGKKKIQKRHKNYKEFYSHYFGDTARTLDIEIENFYHPHKSFTVSEGQIGKKSKATPKKTIRPGQKSFNKTYIDLVLKSTVFKRDLELYLENHFVKDCEAGRHRKVLKFLNHCKKIKDDVCLLHSITTPVQDVDPSKKKMIVAKLRGYILKDGKAKLPWSDSEIISAYNACKQSLGL